jgi:hypothetical protein
VYVSDWPTSTGSGESVFEIDRSARVWTVVACVEESFAELGSSVVVLTVAVFDRFEVRPVFTV